MVDTRFQFKSLTGLRGIAAFYIFLLHNQFAPDVLGSYTANARVAVTMFFVLSGFIMVQTVGLKPVADKRTFWRKRAKRVLPLYYVSLLLSIADVECSISNAGCRYNQWLGFALTLVGLQSFVPCNSADAAWNGVTWSISNELFFYAVFPWLHAAVLRLTESWNQRQIVAALAGFCGMCCFFPTLLLALALSPRDFANYAFPFLFRFPLLRVCDFALGIVIGHLFLRFQVSEHELLSLREPMDHVSGSSSTLVPKTTSGAVDWSCVAVYVSTLAMALILTLFHQHSENGMISMCIGTSLFAPAIAAWLYGIVQHEFSQSFACRLTSTPVDVAYRMTSTPVDVACRPISMGGSRSPLLWLLSCKLLQDAGNVSYAFYLFHTCPEKMVRLAFPWITSATGSSHFETGMVQFLCSVALAVMGTRYVSG